MKKTIIVTIILLGFLYCGKQADQAPMAESKAASPTSFALADEEGPGDGFGRGRAEQKIGSKKLEEKEKDLGRVFFPASVDGLDRYLEYQVSLVYKVEDFHQARQKLLKLVAKYGYLKSSSAHGTGHQSSEVYIKSARLYQALVDFDELGLLTSENISVIDHTEPMVQNKRQANREKLRMLRRQRALKGNVTAKNWQQRETVLARSEDKFDNAEHAQWKIQDKVSWARVSLNLAGPQAGPGIDVPPYEKALINGVNALLELTYGLLYIFPLYILAGLFWWQRKRISGWFKKKEN